MYVVLRSQHIKHTHAWLIQSCRHYYPQTQCICDINLIRIAKPYLIEAKRLYSISSHAKPVFPDCNAIGSYNGNQSNLVRYISISSTRFEKEPLKPSSKVEETVQELKKQDKSTDVAKPVVKKSLMQKIKHEILHYYHGFRLLFIDIKVSTHLILRILSGHALSRREYQLLTRTTGDVFRLIPFSVFVIVPFMELTLPIFLKFFPGMLPSTFQTAEEREDKMKQGLKVKLEMAKFLQGTLDQMAVQHKDRYSDKAKEFSEWFNKVRTSGEQVSNEEIMKFSKLFEDEITLDSLSRSQLIALCRVLDVQTLGTNSFLRFQLRMKLRSLAADDKMIKKEGVESLTLPELQQACRARGMRAYGVSEKRLRTQLEQWLDLSLNQKVPPSLLLLSRAMMLPETIPTSDKLKATISALPETIVKHTQAAIGEKEGKIDNRVRAEIIREEERKIKEERKECLEEKKKMEKDKETLVDKAPIISASATPIMEDTATRISAQKLEKIEKRDQQCLQAQDFEIIGHAIEEVAKEKKLIEKEQIKELKCEMADYKEDIEDLAKVVATQLKPEVKETSAAKHLYKSVNKMITKLDCMLGNLEKKEQQLKKDLEVEVTDKKKEELLKIDDIITAINKIKGVRDPNKIEQITKILRKLDNDRDGSLKIDDVLKVIEMIAKENVKLTSKQIDEVIELLDKEEILEVEDKIEKALQKDKEEIDALKEKIKMQEGGLKECASTDKNKDKNTKPTSCGPTKKTKMDSQSIVAPPSIEKPKSESSSKML